MKIGDLITAEQSTADAKAAADAVARNASKDLADKTADDDKARAVLAAALHRIGPTYVATPSPAEYDSSDGQTVQIKPLNTTDADVPDEQPSPTPTPAPSPEPTSLGVSEPVPGN